MAAALPFIAAGGAALGGAASLAQATRNAPSQTNMPTGAPSPVSTGQPASQIVGSLQPLAPISPSGQQASLSGVQAPNANQTLLQILNSYAGVQKTGNY